MLESKQSSSMAKRKLTYKIGSVCEVNLVNIAASNRRPSAHDRYLETDEQQEEDPRFPGNGELFSP